MRPMKTLATMVRPLAMVWSALAPGKVSASLPVYSNRDVDTTSPRCLNYTKFTAGMGYHVYLPSITPGGAERDCILTIGDRGPGVFVLQDALRRCHEQDIAGDSSYGPATAAAVRNVQSRHGIVADGVYGPQTRAAMAWPRYRDSDNQCDDCYPWLEPDQDSN